MNEVKRKETDKVGHEFKSRKSTAKMEMRIKYVNSFRKPSAYLNCSTIQLSPHTSIRHGKNPKLQMNKRARSKKSRRSTKRRDVS